MINSRICRSFLDNAFDDAQATLTPLRVQLRSNETDAIQAISGGSIISTSANARSVAVASSFGSSTITPVEIVEIWRRLVDAFDQAALSFSDDQSIKNQMMADLRGITGYTANFVYLAK